MRKTTREFGVATTAMWLGFCLAMTLLCFSASAQELVLDANDLALADGQAVTTWGPATASGTPTYREAQTPNGMPAVAFDGADHLGSLLIPAGATGDFIVVAVIRPEAIGAYHNVIDDEDQNRPMLWIDPANRYEMNYGGGIRPAIGSGEAGWDIVIADSRNNVLHVNGLIEGTGGSAIPFTVAEVFDLFNRDGGQTFQGLVAELRVYTDPADFGGDVQALHDELSAKWVGVPAEALSVDIGLTGGALGTQPGFSAFEATYDVFEPLTVTFPSPLGIAGSVDVSIFATTTSSSPVVVHTYRNRGSITGSFSGLSELLGDQVFVTSVPRSGFDTLHLQLNGLSAGAYQITSYHHDRNYPVGDLNVYVDDADGTATVATGLAQTTGSSPASIASLTFSITSDGVNPVTVRLEEIDGTASNAVPTLNGFTIVSITIDSDGDGVPDDQDICPGGDDNVHSDEDGVPDFCDPCPDDAENDADGDGVCGDVDTCPGGDDNQNADGDSLPDFCDVCPLDPDNDADGDGICANDDNCPLIANENQADLDEDLVGDACDDDIDGDGDLNDADNCRFDANPEQADTDGDGAGDVCDDDLDGDGVLDAGDACVPSPLGEVVNADGCAVSELCPCAHPDGADRWKNHGAYVSCVAHASNDFLADGLISGAEKDAIQSAAGESSCGHKNK